MKNQFWMVTPLLLLLGACTNITEKRGSARFTTSGNPALASFAGATDSHSL